MYVSRLLDFLRSNISRSAPKKYNSLNHTEIPNFVNIVDLDQKVRQ